MYTKPFAILKKKGEDNLTYFCGSIKSYNLLSEIDETKEQVFITPFSQAKERGFEVKNNDKKIISIIVDKKISTSIEDFKISFKNKEINLVGGLKEEYNKEDYSKIVDDIITKEIGNGEGSNFCISQKITGKISNFDTQKALTIFERIVESEYGSYMQFIFFDGSEFLIGASPERNVSVDNKTVRMNPISGTFRKSKYKEYGEFKKDFKEFLQDIKEINELFMCVDEELKMMSKICSSGGIIVGPILKEMSNLIHTEYLLSGESLMKKIDVFRESIWACTVVGSPIESAFKIVRKYENHDRNYYAGAITHLTKDSLDSGIMIRTVNINIDGNLEMCVGASIVKDSIGENEYEETKEKSKGILNAILGIKKEKTSFLDKYYLDDEIQELIQIRNQNLSKTWFFKQDTSKTIKNKKILIINNEDDFTNMIAHILKIIGYSVTLEKFTSISIDKVISSDIVLIGPGPGNPLDNNEKMKKNLEIIDYLYKNNKKFFGICLGHQLICRYLGIEVKKKSLPTQGEQIEINLFGEHQKVAFYNTFAGFYKNCHGDTTTGTGEGSNPVFYSSPARGRLGGGSIIQEKGNNRELKFSKKEDGELYGIKGENFFSFQFHPESILTQNGLKILQENLDRIIG